MLNLLIVLGQHSDHLTVSSILMNGQIEQTGFGLCLPTLPIVDHDFTNSPPSSRLNSSDGGCGGVSADPSYTASAAVSAEATAAAAAASLGGFTGILSLGARGGHRGACWA